MARARQLSFMSAELAQISPSFVEIVETNKEEMCISIEIYLTWAEQKSNLKSCFISYGIIHPSYKICQAEWKLEMLFIFGGPWVFLSAQNYKKVLWKRHAWIILCSLHYK